MLSMFSAINLMKQEIAFRKNYDKIEWLMKIKKISKMRLVALCVETHLKKSCKTEQETDKYQKSKNRGRALQASLLKNIRRFATIAALHRATDGIGDVLLAFVFHIFLINISRIPAFFTMKNHGEHLLAQNAEKLSNQKR